MTSLPGVVRVASTVLLCLTAMCRFKPGTQGCWWRKQFHSGLCVHACRASCLQYTQRLSKTFRMLLAPLMMATSLMLLGLCLGMLFAVQALKLWMTVCLTRTFCEPNRTWIDIRTYISSPSSMQMQALQPLCCGGSNVDGISMCEIPSGLHLQKGELLM